MEGNNESLVFKKTISRSMHFLKNIWCSGNNDLSKDEQDTRKACSHVTDSNKYIVKRSDIAKTSSLRNEFKAHKTESDIQDRKERNTTTTAATKNSSLSLRAGCVEDTSTQKPNCRLVDDVTITDSRWTPERFLTEDFLDTVLITKVEQRKKLSYFYMQSRVLYKYLSYHLGSKKMIQIRRKVLTCQYSGFINESSRSLKISGSRAEGLNMSESDADFMISYIEAYEDTVPRPECFKCAFNSLEYIAIPGYVSLTKRVNGQNVYISSSMLMSSFLQLLNNTCDGKSFTLHGPAICPVIRNQDIDLVYSVKCPTWPKISEEWKNRNRKCGWPSQEMINNIVSKGCHIVPVCSKVEEINGTEWRLSFSMAEKQLVWSFNHVQILIYGLLKLLLKEVIEKNEALKGLLCSYFLKTTLFWAIEETNASLWEPKYTILCFYICLTRLIEFVIEEHCPNYFVQINNMFLGKFVPKQKETLLRLLCSISEQGLSWVVQSKTMSNLLPYVQDPYTATRMYQAEKIKENKETTMYMIDLIGSCRTVIRERGVIGRKSDEIQKSILQYMLIETSAVHHLAHFIDTHNRKMNNKEKHACKRLVLNLIMHGTKDVPISRNLFLSSWLYAELKFKECLSVTESSLTNLIPTRLNLDPKLSELPGIGNQEFQECALKSSPMTISLDLISQIVPVELLSVLRCIVKNDIVLRFVTSNEPIYFSFTSKSYFHFIQCLCYLKFGAIKHFDKSIGELRNIRYRRSDIQEEFDYVMLSLLRITALLAKSEKCYIRDKKALILNEICDCCSYYLTRISEVPKVRDTSDRNPRVSDISEVYQQILYQLDQSGFFKN